MPQAPVDQEFQLPDMDPSRAMRFYSVTLTVPLKEGFGGGREDEGVPGSNGITLYFGSHPDLAVPLQAFEDGGAKVLAPSAPAGPGVCFFAVFEDPEGNYAGVVSPG